MDGILFAYFRIVGFSGNPVIGKYDLTNSTDKFRHQWQLTDIIN